MHVPGNADGPLGWVTGRGRWRAERSLHRALAAGSPRYARARAARERLRLSKDLSPEESRQSELIEHLGWDVASRAPACRRWFFGDDPKLERFLDRLGITYEQYAVMHQYLAFDRMDPDRPDLFWVFDEVMARLERLGGPDRLSVLDFGGGQGQMAVAFAGEGYRTVLTDALPYRPTSRASCSPTAACTPRSTWPSGPTTSTTPRPTAPRSGWSSSGRRWSTSPTSSARCRRSPAASSPAGCS